MCPEIYKALEGILFIAEHKKRMEESTKVTDQIYPLRSYLMLTQVETVQDKENKFRTFSELSLT